MSWPVKRDGWVVVLGKEKKIRGTQVEGLAVELGGQR